MGPADAPEVDRLLQDAMIAVVAVVHRLTVVIRNTRDFEQLSVPTLDPFARRDRGAE